MIKAVAFEFHSRLTDPLIMFKGHFQSNSIMEWEIIVVDWESRRTRSVYVCVWLRVCVSVSQIMAYKLAPNQFDGGNRKRLFSKGLRVVLE